MRGFVQVPRELLDNGILATGGSRLWGLYMYLLLCASWRPRIDRGVNLLPDQLVTTAREIAESCRLSPKQARCDLNRLKRMGVIEAHQVANRFTVITVCNYGTYSDDDQSKGQTAGHAEGQPRANQGQAGGLNPCAGESLSTPNKEKRRDGKNKETDPRVVTLGEKISAYYLESTGLPFMAQGQMRNGLKQLLNGGKGEDEILAAYRAFLADRSDFYRDHSWGKFPGWWAAHNEAGRPTPSPFGRDR
jgi:hypothetical protein